MHKAMWGWLAGCTMICASGAPAGTPRPIIDRLNAEMVKALRAPDMEQLLRDQGSRVVTNSPDEFAAFIRKEQEELAALVKATGAKLD
jgi:tripartite-type tricarboxylate transporter receptor subunit TctC